MPARLAASLGRPLPSLRETPKRLSLGVSSQEEVVSVCPSPGEGVSAMDYSTVTLFARFRGWSTSAPRRTPMK
jgi:hypothetical protein